MKKYVVLILLFMFSFVLISCNAGTMSDRTGDYEGGGIDYYLTPEGIKDIEYYSSKLGEDITVTEENKNVQSGQLSAAANNDNEHYEFLKSLIQKGQTEEGPYYSYHKDFKDAFGIENRIKLTFKDNKLPRKVTLLDSEDKVLCSGVPTNDGILYLFPEQLDSYKVDIEYIEDSETKHLYDTITTDKEYTLDSNSISNNLLELMFIIDTTGSMGDEIDYLKAELKDVITRVYNKNEGIQINTAILVYRDTSDEYITKYSDFSSDINVSLNFLKDKEANGGGDFEEAVEVAFKEALEKQWSTDSTKLIIHVADAPSHDNKVAEWANTIKEIAEKGIRIITVASSGIDKQTEYFFRCQSLITNGYYTHLTNHSGIGGDHITPDTETEEIIEYLNSMLVRLINGYVTGTFEEPIPYPIENAIEDTEFKPEDLGD